MTAQPSTAQTSTARRPTLRPFDESLPMALLRAREATMRRFRPILAEHDLTEQQWRVLRALAAHSAAGDDGLEVSQLAESTFLLGPSLSRILTNIERRGLITRGISTADRRRADIAITDDGRALVADIAPASEREYAAIESTIGADRLADLLDLLHELEGSAPTSERDRLRPSLRPSLRSA